jgi:ATP-binding protein involved in chromosome partitioning
LLKIQSPKAPLPRFTAAATVLSNICIIRYCADSVLIDWSYPLSSPIPPHAAQPAPGPQPLPGVDAIIAVGSGKGGVGKTTLAVNLAVALARMGHKVGLLDGDVYGPNVPLMLGVNQQPRMAGENRIEPLEAFGVKVISVGFLNPGDKPIIWRGPMLHQIVKQFLGQVAWGHLDYMVVDLPPGTGDIALSLVQSVPLTGAVVVSTPSDVSLQDARKAVEMFRQMKVDLVGVVENMSYFVCPHCNHEIDIFSRGGAENMSKHFGVPFLGSIELDPEVRKAGDGGRPVVLEGETSPHAKSIYQFAQKVLARVTEIKAGEGAGVIQIQ